MSIKSLKFGLSLMNIYFFVFAGYIFWAFGQPTFKAISYSSFVVNWDKNANIPMIILISLIVYSVLLALVSTYLGMFAIHEEKRPLIIVYVVILVLCIGCQIGIFLAKNGGEPDAIRESVIHHLERFSLLSKEEQLKIQKFQQSVQCCGFRDSRDYSRFRYNVADIPNSCCGLFDPSGESDQRGACMKADLEKVSGCGEKIHKVLGSPFVSYVFDLSFYAVCFVQILAIVLSLKLRRELKFKRTESKMPIHDKGHY